MAARCRSCAKTVLWVTTENGKKMPAEESENGNLLLENDLLGDPVARVVDPGEGTHVSHFATCPQAEGWRR
jgi:hypothetical protein